MGLWRGTYELRRLENVLTAGQWPGEIWVWLIEGREIASLTVGCCLQSVVCGGVRNEGEKSRYKCLPCPADLAIIVRNRSRFLPDSVFTHRFFACTFHTPHFSC